jgi:hypothetical protein
MPRQTSGEPQDPKRDDSPTRKSKPFSMETAAQARDALARTIGTPEHAALVAAVRRNFPEIYEELKDKPR